MGRKKLIKTPEQIEEQRQKTLALARKYQTEHRKNNRESVREYMRQYRIEKAKQIAESKKKYEEKNKELIAKRRSEHRIANPEIYRQREKNRDKEKQRIYEMNYREANIEKVRKRSREKWKQYYYENPDKYRSRARQYSKSHPEIAKASNMRRKARTRSAPGRFTSVDIKKLLNLQKGKCTVCKRNIIKTGYHIDHIYPISKGGSNWPENLQLLCQTCNLRKSAKDPIEWANSLGMLL